ncbi:MAG: hypothetical protein JWN43_3238 [Gammaproteobacteria bacterium]|nr:hypothetical protein [Gammaproteobacteria bacterium]
MSAAVAMKREIAVEDRIAGLESDMRYVRSDIAEMKGDIKSLGTELHAFKTEVAKEFGNVRTEIATGLGGLRADMHKEFGSIRTSIEQAKLWMLVTGVGAVILTTFATLGRVLRWF